MQLKRIRNDASCEKKLFEQEICELRQDAKLKPVLVKDPNSKEFMECIRKLSPYFFLSHSGPLFKKELLESIRGVAINQHAGWSPTYKGAATTEWALYHRNLDYVGSTVHITTTGADAGPILRRSHPCLVSSDTIESCFARVAALGTELMIEVVKGIISNKEILVYDQPVDVGKTYITSQLDRSALRAIYRDFSDNWLERELLRLSSF